MTRECNLEWIIDIKYSGTMPQFLPQQRSYLTWPRYCDIRHKLLIRWQWRSVMGVHHLPCQIGIPYYYEAQYNIEVLTLVYLHHMHGCLHKCSSSKDAAVQHCQLVTTLDRGSSTGGVQKCMQTGN